MPTEKAYPAASAGCEVVRNIAPLGESDDFDVMLPHRPGNYGLLGNRRTDHKESVPLHNAKYDFNDDALASGIAYFTALVSGSS